MLARLQLPQLLGYAPLLPLAAAATLGLVADRYLAIPIPASFAFVILMLIARMLLMRAGRTDLAIVPLWLCGAALAAVYHHASRDLYPADDIGNLAREQPELKRFRGELMDEPTVRPAKPNDPLRAWQTSATFAVRFRVGEIMTHQTWQPASGIVQLRGDGMAEGLHSGTRIETVGWLSPVPLPLNPGEFDHAARLRDQRIRAELYVRHAPESIQQGEGLGTRTAVSHWLARVRGRGERILEGALPARVVGIASALLLGDTSAMSNDDWQIYVRTGVVHVLAISGQHLVVLAGFLWFVCRVIGLSARRSAVVVALILIFYALLTGGRPSAMRAALMVSAVCGGIILGRQALPANTFALAWLLVLAFNPADLFTPGFQLSFLCVAMLIWAIPRWFPIRELTPFEQLIDDSRSAPTRLIRHVVSLIGRWYLLTLILMLSTVPLVMSWQNIISPVGVLIGPPAILLTSVALIAGFMIFPLSLLGAWAVWLFARLTAWCIEACDWLVRLADRLPFGCIHVSDVPAWWVVGFYIMLVVSLSLVRIAQVQSIGGNPFARIVSLLRPATLVLLVGIWTGLGLLAGAAKPASGELRLTFLAVGHGGCIAIETPDGRVLLYDAGSLAGPDVTRRTIAPFLWSRGISRIDEVFISHADLDHFNGLQALAERFTIGQISLTPSFEQKPAPGVKSTLAELRRHGLPIRVVSAGDRFETEGVSFRILHPPTVGPPGNENARSLVMLIAYRGQRILLTGDLEQNGMQDVLDGEPQPVDVLLAPHHGSRLANPQRLVDWANPRLAIASEGPGQPPGDDIYTQNRIPYWMTSREGAITVRISERGLSAETFRTGQRIVMKARMN